MHNETHHLLTSAAVCERLGCNRATLTRWVKGGRLNPSLKMPGLRGAYLFASAEVDRFLQGRAA